jgi:transcriptional regulator with XRE-family HTH domain
VSSPSQAVPIRDLCPNWKPLLNQEFAHTVSGIAMTDSVSDRARRRVREEMERLKLNQTDFADRLRWRESRLSKILNAKIELGVDDLAELCGALGLSLVEAVRDHGLEFCADMRPMELRFLERLRQLHHDQADALMTVLNVAATTRRQERRATPPPVKKRRHAH